MPCRLLCSDGASPFIVIHVFSERFTPTLKASSFCLSTMSTKKETSSMSTETNKALVHHAIEKIWNQGNVTLTNELYTPNIRFQNPDATDVHTLEDFKRL